MFTWTAQAAGTDRQADAAPAEYMAVQQEKLALELALSQAVADMEDKLSAARTENKTLEKKNEQLAQDYDELSEAQVNVADSIMLNYKGEYYATSYCCEQYPHICGGNGRTASGTVPTPGLTVAADWGDLAPGTWIYIEDVGIRRVEDSGSAIKGKRIDVAVDTHANALRWPGQGRHRVWALNME
uniref:3D domain-containing protein n=1 Tax=termite gut metagenome TaxID=433724 RepID=S0DFG4_9ZZZZ